MAHQRAPSGSQPDAHGDTTLTKVFVGGLAWETRSDALRLHFEQYGEVLEAAVVCDKTTGRSKGYGFVTFRDPEAANRACADPTPLIDGRWANCNLASLGRPQLVPLYGHLKQANSHVGRLQIMQRDFYGGSFQQPLPYSYYHQGHVYPPYGYATYGPKYLYPLEIHNPYTGQPYFPIYDAPGPITSSVYQYDRFGQTVPSGYGYSLTQGFMMPGHQIMPHGALTASGLATSTVPSIPVSYPSGHATTVTGHPQFPLSVPPVLFSDSAQMVYINALQQDKELSNRYSQWRSSDLSLRKLLILHPEGQMKSWHVWRSWKVGKVSEWSHCGRRDWVTLPWPAAAWHQQWVVMSTWVG